MHRFLAIVSLAALALTGCSDTMSCTLKNKSSGMSERCIEYSKFSWTAQVNAKASLSLLCEAFGADVEQQACDTTGALVGCDENYQDAWQQTEWFWAVEGKPTAASFSCESNETRVGPDRAPLPTE